MSSSPPDRRRFLTAVAGAGCLAGGCARPGAAPPAAPPARAKGPAETPVAYPAVRPNVILVRFGGGVRRQETVSFPERTCCPFLLHELAGKHGVLFANVEIASQPGVVTSHREGTLYLLTGEYGRYTDVSGVPLAYSFIPDKPTLPEYLRRRYSDVGPHQALIVNSEDRVSEEFYNHSNHHLFGVGYRSSVLSLFAFRTHLLRRRLADPRTADDQRGAARGQLARMLAQDYRGAPPDADPRLEAFWDGWRRDYGKTGLVNPRGDRLLTALALRALEELRPRFLMVNYQDTDYVHWGPAHFYPRALGVIDDGLRQLYRAVQADEFYRDNTVFVVVPDCGRDNNRGMAVPFQHHFGSKTAHEIFAVVAGPARFVPRGITPIDRPQQQISVAATVGALMGFTPTHADAPSLFEVV